MKPERQTLQHIELRATFSLVSPGSFISFLFLSFLLLSSPVFGQTVETGSKARIIFEPQLIPATTADDNASQEYNQQPSTDTPALDEAASISTPERTAYFDQLDRLEDQVNQLTEDEGVYSPGLIDTYQAMAEIYLANYQLENAYAAYASAAHIIRIREGPNTETQLPLLQAQADILIKQGLSVEGHQTLVNIKNIQLRSSRDNPSELIKYRLEYARDNLALVANSYHHNTPDPLPAIDALLGIKNELAKSALEITENIQDSQLLISALNRDMVTTNYHLETILEENDGMATILFENGGLEAALARYAGLEAYLFESGKIKVNYPFINTTSEYFRLEAKGSSWTAPPDSENGIYIDTSKELQSNLSILGTFSGDYSPMMEGIFILQAELERIEESEADPLSVFEAMINLADYSVITGYQYTNDARELYEEAYGLLKQSGQGNVDTLIRDTFSPDIPVQIPTYTTSDYSRDTYSITEYSQQNAIGFIDVSFRLDRNGHAKRIKVLSRSPQLSKETEELLVQDLRYNHYRPVFEDDRPVRKDFSLRYFVSILE